MVKLGGPRGSVGTGLGDGLAPAGVCGSQGRFPGRAGRAWLGALPWSFGLPVLPRGSRCLLVALAGFTAHLSEVGPAAELELEDERAVGHLVHILALCRGHREGEQGHSRAQEILAGFARMVEDAAVMKKLLRTSLIKVPKVQFLHFSRCSSFISQGQGTPGWHQRQPEP